MMTKCLNCAMWQTRAERAEAALHEWMIIWHLERALAKYGLVLE